MSTANHEDAKKKLDWDTAVADAKAEINKAQRRIAQLTRSIETFRKFKAAGEPFPEGPGETAQDQ